MEQKQIGVSFSKPPKVYYYNPNNLELKKGDFVVAETARGIELGSVATEIIDYKGEEQLKLIIRIATSDDLKNNEANNKKIQNYITNTKKHIKELKLDMKIISAELTLDRSKIIISFTADNRVDFRELVRVLASDFKMKIELRQIGARDAVQIMGGCGICGKTCCCCNNTGDFEHVSIKMAKIQGLSLNPNNITGMCGKLLCCLSYENKQYVEVFKKMPKVNSEVITKNGKGRVLFNNLLKNTVSVKINDEIEEYPLEEIKVAVYNDQN